MGNVLAIDPRRMEEIERSAIPSLRRRLTAGPDIGVSGCLVKFTSLSSGEHLKLHYETRKAEASSSAADRLKELTEKLTAFAPFPEAAGLGALAIAILIDNTLRPPDENLAEVIQSVFAEEKVFGVWDLIDECLKRFTMHAVSTERLREDIKRIESQLSLALTKLKNSMLRDGNMTHQALKVWVNGAAFHIHMLIHQEKLGGNPACKPIEGLLSVYRKDLDQLFDKHKEMVKGKCSLETSIHEREHYSTVYCFFKDEDSRSYDVNEDVRSETYKEAFYDFRYSKQKTDIEKYFTEVGQNLPELVQQKGSFNQLVPVRVTSPALKRAKR